MDFDDTETAFRNRSNHDLERAERIFKAFDTPLWWRWLQIKAGTLGLWTNWPLFETLIQRSGFDHFYGGENLEEAQGTMRRLRADGVRSILDYSVEAVEKDADLDATRDELLRVIAVSADNQDASFVVFKMSGVARQSILMKASKVLSGMSVRESASAVVLQLDSSDLNELALVYTRVGQLCSAASDAHVPILIDAEHSWLQPAIDWIAIHMMQTFNEKASIVYNTIQMYRVGRLEYLKQLCEFSWRSHFIPGIKIVRGAYMEEERRKAKRRGLASPIQPTKAATDRDYDAALTFCVDHLEDVTMLAATHSETSLLYLVELLQARGVPPNDPRVAVAQLLGMRDNVSVILANNGYNVSKYVPFGPIRQAFPYLTRRALENRSIEGQMGRELMLIRLELARRKDGGT